MNNEKENILDKPNGEGGETIIDETGGENKFTKVCLFRGILLYTGFDKEVSI